MIGKQCSVLLTILFIMGMILMHSQAGGQESMEIALEKPDHQHIYEPGTFKFRVTQGQARLPSLKPVITFQWIRSGSAKVVPLAPGQIQDAGNGEYLVVKTFSGPGAYAITLSFAYQGQTYFRTFLHDLSLAGGERMFRPSKEAPQYNYQIRWQANPPNVPVDKEVAFLIELKRTVKGAKINVERPFTSTFDHLIPATLKGLPEVALKALGDGSEMRLSPAYKGLGVYEVKHKFSPAETGKKYQLRVAFTDDAGFTIDETGEDYRFPVGGAD